MTYLLDANVFIEAKNAHYGFDIVPAFWQWLEQAHAAGLIHTVEKVADEILEGGDELADWMKGRPKSFRVAVTPADEASLQAVAAWAAGASRFTQAALSEFLQGADYYLVAQARSYGYTVVTHERPDPKSKKRVKIPDACNGVGVNWMSPFQMLKVESVQFTLLTGRPGR